MRRLIRGSTTAIAAALVAASLTACGPDQGHDADPGQVDATAVPNVGECRDLDPSDVRRATNATRTVECTEPHTAVTIASGEVPESTTSATSSTLAAWAYRTCSTAFAQYLGADESTAMRTLLGWAWFRPSPQAWDDGARWYRCDLIGGSQQGDALLDLPRDAKKLLAQRATDAWMACVDGPSVDGAARVACTAPHQWRAVTTIKLGEDDDPYPGDETSRRRTSQFCSDSVAAWLGYPASYDFGYTWFGRSEWELGNRRAVCWARTTH